MPQWYRIRSKDCG